MIFQKVPEAYQINDLIKQKESVTQALKFEELYILSKKATNQNC